MGRRQDLDTALTEVTTHSPASHKWQHSPASHKWQHTVLHPTSDNTVRHPTSDNTQSCIPQVTTHSPASHKGQHTVRHYFPWHFNNTLINTVTFHNSRPFVKICWLSLRIAHLKHTPKLYVHLFPNPRVSSMGWLPSPEPRLTAGGDTWNTKTKLTLSTLASPGVWQRKCGSPIQCQRLWPGNID